jgi:hypothetical protein
MSEYDGSSNILANSVNKRVRAITLSAKIAVVGGVDEDNLLV